jgi:ABC-type iron transport system FetAB permease component
MTTFFDLFTVACFTGMIIVFFKFTDREVRTLIQFVLIGIVLAVANQVGNAGSVLLAAALIFAGAAYVVVLARS